MNYPSCRWCGGSPRHWRHSFPGDSDYDPSNPAPAPHYYAPDVTDEFVALVREHLEATSDASMRLVQEFLDGNRWPPKTPEDELAFERRRAELWALHLAKAGLTIGREV